MCENSQSSVDEVVSLVADDQSMEKHATIAFSKKAMHQQDADENLFLRFLELDPVETPPPSSSTAGAAAPQGTPSSQRRQSSIRNVLINSPPPQQGTAQPSPATTAIRNSLGRTPFTVTKRLQRDEEKGYGFSILWTHPPRVEKVEASLPADRAGIFPGDFVIFVDKHNVVTMPELDILNLIRSQGATMTLEIFRRPAGQQQPQQQQQTTSRPSSGLMKTSSIESERRERYPSTSSNTNQEVNFAGGAVLNGGTANTNNNNVTSSSCSSVRVNNEPGSAVNSVASNFVVNASNGDTENNNNNNNNNINNNNNNSSSQSANVRPLQSSGVLNLGTRSSIGCSNASMETTKRRLHLPQVTFSKEVGHGVIV